jgi:hypothetical protein
MTKKKKFKGIYDAIVNKTGEQINSVHPTLTKQDFMDALSQIEYFDNNNKEHLVWELVHSWCDMQGHEIPDMNRRALMDKIITLIDSLNSSDTIEETKQ